MGELVSENWGTLFGDLGLSAANQDALRDELAYRVKQQEILAREAQAQMAASTAERFMLETGEVQLQVHAFFYHYWGQRLGYECWDDPAFVKEFIRDNEEVRVKSRPRKVTIGHGGGLDPAHAPARVRFHKVYA